MLVDIVSRCGNFLLGVGPTSDGRIPVIMEERLAQIGKWLDVNGEAIFGTRCWIIDSQRSDGPRPEFKKYDHHFGESVLEMTFQPKLGSAVKELYFTRKGSTLYALVTSWLKSNVLIVKNIRTSSDTQIALLGCTKEIFWKQSGDDIEISLKNIEIQDLPCEHIYTFSLTNYQAASDTH